MSTLNCEVIVRNILSQLLIYPNLQYSEVCTEFDILEEAYGEFGEFSVDWVEGCMAYSHLMKALYDAKGYIFECQAEIQSFLSCVESRRFILEKRNE